MKLCLGTVQFGMKYGINNSQGQPSLERCVEMMNYAVRNGIDSFDTATAYNEAESVVGHFLSQTPDKVNVISKLRPNCIEDSSSNIGDIIENELKSTLKKLNVKSIYGYLLHNADYLYNDKVIATLKTLKGKGLIKHFGVSIYDVKDGFYGIDNGCTIVQAPYSVFDQRIRSQNLLSYAKEKNIEVHTRSAFLQGLLMMDVPNIPDKLNGIIPYVEKLNSICSRYGIDKKQTLIAFVKQTEGIEKLVFGVDNINQLEEFIRIFNEASLPEQVINELRLAFNDISEDLILPNRW